MSSSNKTSDKVPGLVKFNSSVPLEFNHWAKQFVAYLNCKKWFYHIDFANPAVHFDAQGEPVEEVFPQVRICPVGGENALALARQAAATAAINATLQANLALWAATPNAAPQWIAQKSADSTARTNDLLARIALDLPRFLKEVRDEAKVFDDLKKEWDEERSALSALMLGYVGTTALNVSRGYITAGRLRKAWVTISRHFSGQLGMVSGLNETHATIDNMVFSPVIGTAFDHWNRLLELNELLIAGGEAGQAPNRLLEKLFQAMERSPDGKIYAPAISFARMLAQPPELVLSKLKEAETTQRIAQGNGSSSSSSAGSGKKTASKTAAVTGSFKKKKRASQDQQTQQVKESAVPKDMSNWCPYHKISGHNADTCWSLHPELKKRKNPFTTDRADVSKHTVEDTAVSATQEVIIGKDDTTVVEVIGRDVVVGGSHDPMIDETLLHDLLQAWFVPHVCQACQGMGVKNHTSTLRIIIDSGASCTMLPCDALFKGHIEPVQGKVLLGDTRYQLESVGYGYTNLDVLGEVLYVPSLTFGLISVSALDRAGLTTEFKDGRVWIYNAQGEILLSGWRMRDLYYLESKYVDMLWCNSTCKCDRERRPTGALARDVASEDGDVDGEVNTLRFREVRIGEQDPAKGSANPKPSQTTSGVHPFDLLHHELGHMSESNLKKALRNENLLGTKVTYDQVKDLHLRFCPACMEGRMHAFPRVKDDKDSESYKIYEKFSIDYKGKFREKSIDGYTGFYLVSDYATNNQFVFLVKSKGEAATLKVLNDFMAIVDSERGEARVMQCDYDTVLLCKGIGAWLTEHKLKLQVSAPYVHSQNGFVEVSIGKVMDKARTLMVAGMVPKYFWSYAVRHAVFMLNRTPVRGSKVTPYEARFHTPPDVSALVPFYCTGVCHKTAEERKGPWDRKALRCFMVGMDERVKNGYLVVFPKTRKVLTRYACVWDERSFISLSYGYDAEHLIKEPEHDDIDIFTEDQDLASGDEEDADDMSEEEDKKLDDSDDSDGDQDSEDMFGPELTQDEPDSGPLWPVRKPIVGVTQAMIEIKNLPKLPTVSTWEEAMASPYAKEWYQALINKLENFDSRHVFYEADQLGRAMKTKLVFRVSYTEDYQLKFRVRLVACGYSQIYGIDYKDTYSPTTTALLVFILVLLGACFGFDFATFDVSAAFLEGLSDFVNYARLPAILGGHRVEVVGNFYGEKQGPKIWNDHVNDILIEYQFERCPAHPCLYRWVNGNDFIIITLHVDDGLAVTNCISVMRTFFDYFLTKVQKATLQYPVSRYVGLNMSYDKEERTVELSHELYITTKWGDIQEVYDTPMSASVNLRKSTSVPGAPSLLKDTGEFRYIADWARPDMLLVTGELATGGDRDPSLEHTATLQRAKGYLANTPKLGLSLGGLGKVQVFGYSDAAYITDGNCKSRLGGCVFLNTTSGAVRSWSKNDTVLSTISHSSTEAEIRAIDEWIREVCHIMDLLTFVCGEVSTPIKLFVDNLSAIELCESLKQNHKVKHINVRIHYIRQMIEEGLIELHFCPSKKNVADMLTKALAFAEYVAHRYKLMKGHDGREPGEWTEEDLQNEIIHFVLDAAWLKSLQL